MAMQKPLENILLQIQTLGDPSRSMCVFDLDSTLFDVSPRIQKILDDYSQIPVHQQRFAENVQILQTVKTQKTDWGIKNALLRAGLDSAHPEFFESIRAFWAERFFSNEYLVYDQPFDGAVEFVQKLVQLKTKIVYLSGRDEIRMGLGTRKVLRKWGFPVEGAAEVALKASHGYPDDLFKSEWFAKNAKMFQPVWFFENEPVNIELVRRDHPQVQIIFFDSTHSGKAARPLDLPAIMHFLLDEV